mmetsp:Transcript_28853/g.73610  ORF Transcript_28853/g.73610 Transcript_28853/m.73610 type:complete len:200 (-) Transcript_28853:389-988(-)
MEGGQQGMPGGMPYQGGFPSYPPQQYPTPQYQQPNNAYAEQLRGFWQEQYREIEQVPADAQEFKNHQLPLARIKKIMKSDEDVRMISAEAPVLFAKACEMFILELTLRSWYHAEENKRRTLQRNDIAAAITRTDIFDFLIDIVPREDLKPEEGGAGTAGPSGAPAGAPSAGYAPYPPMDPAQMMGYPQQGYQQGGYPPQ